MIYNFILTRYRREFFENMPSNVKEHFGSMDMKLWDEVQEKLFQQQINQLKKMYPWATIHLITNDLNRTDERLEIHRFPKMNSNHLCKLKAYSLLTESAMYIDNDIVLFRPFESKHLDTDNAFNFYQKSKAYNLQSLAKTRLPLPVNHHYNAGLIWIKKPNPYLSEQFFEIHEKYFSDSELIMSQQKWADSDELPIAVFIAQKKLSMKLCSELAVHRNTLSFSNVTQQHSVHYTGIDIKCKQLCLHEYLLKYIIV